MTYMKSLYFIQLWFIPAWQRSSTLSQPTTVPSWPLSSGRFWSFNIRTQLPKGSPALRSCWSENDGAKLAQLATTVGKRFILTAIYLSISIFISISISISILSIISLPSAPATLKNVGFMLWPTNSRFHVQNHGFWFLGILGSSSNTPCASPVLLLFVPSWRFPLDQPVAWPEIILR